MTQTCCPGNGPVFSLRLLTALVLQLCAAFVFAQISPIPAGPEDLSQLTDGEAIYNQACSTCHGVDGRGSPIEHVGFDVPLPDFTDCSYASREQSAEWVGIAHEGGPLRSFSTIMPAFGKALTVAQLEAAVAHIRKFCTDKRWPRGEFNLPRPLITGKAFLEDEDVMTTTINTEGAGSVENTFVMEKRLGARSEFEVGIPFSWEEISMPGGDSNWHGDIGDIALELKRAMYDNLDSGTLISASGELVLPTGSGDSAVFEPQLLLGQLLPSNSFLHGQFGLELPVKRQDAEDEMYWRLALGKTFQEPNWGRSWTPMLEVLGSKVIDESGSTQWDLVPQLQVSLSKRQHIVVNFGFRVPVTDRGPRATQFIMYFMWDWYDGGLLEAW